MLPHTRLDGTMTLWPCICGPSSSTLLATTSSGLLANSGLMEWNNAACCAMEYPHCSLMSTMYSTAARRCASAVMLCGRVRLIVSVRCQVQEWGKVGCRGRRRRDALRPGPRFELCQLVADRCRADPSPDPRRDPEPQPRTCISMVLRSSSGRSRMPGVSMTCQRR